MKITKSIIIDIEYLKLTPLNLNHLLTLLKIKFYNDKDFLNYVPTKEDLQYLKDNNYIFYFKNTIIPFRLKSRGKLILNKSIKIKTEKIENNKVILKDISIKDEIEDFNKLVNQFRSRFKDLKVGSMGNLKSVKDKLFRWLKSNPEVTHKEILEATDLYIQSLNGDYRYLQRADYFIYKQNHRKEESSRLSLFIEENNKEVVNSDWTATIK